MSSSGQGAAGTGRASSGRVDVEPSAKPARRWSKRRLIIVVSSLLLGLVLLVVSVVGFGHSLGFVMTAADAVGDVREIAPERAAPAGSAVPVGSPVSNVSQATAPTSSGGANADPSELPSMAFPAGPVGGMAGASGSGGATATSETSAQAGGGAAASPTAGTAGAAPSAWDEAVQGALALLSQNTISMCGRNTCNTGQVCCNASCGVCVAPGATCDQQQCAGAPRVPTAVLCGRGQCNDGQVCCNASCGICAAPGETCSDQPCQ